MAGIQLLVEHSKEDMWHVRIGYEPWRHFQSERAAMNAALQRAKEMSADGIECEVVMKVMTLQFGPEGFFKAVPTPRDFDWEQSDSLPDGGRRDAVGASRY